MSGEINKNLIQGQKKEGLFDSFDLGKKPREKKLEELPVPALLAEHGTAIHKLLETKLNHYHYNKKAIPNLHGELGLADQKKIAAITHMNLKDVVEHHGEEQGHISKRALLALIGKATRQERTSGIGGEQRELQAQATTIQNGLTAVARYATANGLGAPPQLVGGHLTPGAIEMFKEQANEYQQRAAQLAALQLKRRVS